MAGGELKAQVLPARHFDWSVTSEDVVIPSTSHNVPRVFLVELLGFGAVTLVFLFWFNRIFAFIVSHGIRAYTWHTHRVYISFQALQVSLLAGRIFFKGARYHGHNETILINDGYITWRYWLRRTKEADVRDLGQERNNNNRSTRLGGGPEVSGGEQGETVVQHELPCRILIEVRGLEWFVYNRSPAYDAILSNIPTTAAASSSSELSEEGLNSQNEDNVSTSQDSCNYPENEKVSGSFINKNNSADKVDDSVFFQEKTTPVRVETGDTVRSHSESDKPLPSFLSVLPIGVECDRGAIVVGNENTKSVLIAKFERAKGEIGAQGCQRMDLYRQTFDFDITHPVVQLKYNKEYKETQMASAVRSGRPMNDNLVVRPATSIRFFYRNTKHRVFHVLSGLIPTFRRSVESLTPDLHHLGDSNPREPGTEGAAQNKWLGLSRYLDEDDDGLFEHERWKATEYASFETIIDSPSVGLSFFWDIPGPVLGSSADLDGCLTGFEKDINGSRPPAWQIDLRLGGGNINYGPWADRQRADLQTYFFPAPFKDVPVAVPLKPGQTRVATVFTLRVEIESHTTIRIPTREGSKDWKWKNNVMTREGSVSKSKLRRQLTKSKNSEKHSVKSEVRPPGWLDMTVSQNTCVTYNMDMVASGTGFRSKLELDIVTPEISSSVNHGLLLRSKSQTIFCDLSSPLKWNAQRNWLLDITSDELELFILRDHIFLLTDLVNDWTTGPPGEFHTFVPFIYSMQLQLPNFQIYLNANDSNIINNPSNVDDNTFVVVWGQKLTTNLSIPLKEYRPTTSKVTFDIDASHGGFKLHTPLWNTQRTFLDTSEVATLKDLHIDGSYNYFTSTSPNLTDTVLLNVHGFAPSINLYGFLVRYFMKLKDNYFGEDLHFQTLEEYQARICAPTVIETANVDGGVNGRLSNDLDVILTVMAQNSSLMLPANLYSAEQNVKIEVSSILLDLRFTNYYMDLEVSFTPLAISCTNPEDPHVSSNPAYSNTQAFVDGIAVSGHRLFGLPPVEPTYVCNWDFDVGKIVGECSTGFIYNLVSALRCFAFTFSDNENALPPHRPIVIHDVTFLRATVQPICLWIHIEHAAFLFKTETVYFNFNDWAGTRFSNRLHMTVPELILACVDNQTASRHRSGREYDVITHAYMQTSVDIRMVSTNPHFAEDQQLQQDHIFTHDARTERTTWLLVDSVHNKRARPLEQNAKPRPATMPYPPMPEPVYTPQEGYMDVSENSSNTVYKSVHRKTARRQGSFLTTVSSRQRSRTSVAKEEGSDLTTKESSIRSREPRNLSGLTHARFAAASPTLRNTYSRQVSFQSVSGMCTLGGVGPPPSTVTFSSSYEAPYYPLQNVNPNTQYVPEIHGYSDGDNTYGNIPLEQELPEPQDEDTKNTAISMCLGTGIKAYCTPEALGYVNCFLGGLLAKEPAAILDSIQMSVMADVPSQQPDTPTPKSVQIRLQLPYASVRFINQLTSEVTRQQLIERQYYDVNALHLVLTAKMVESSRRDPLANPSHGLLIHIDLEQLCLSARSKVEAQVADQAQVNVAVSNLSTWLVIDPGITAEIQFESLAVVSSNRQVESLASLLNITTTMVERLVMAFQRTTTQYKRRRQQLIFLLATSETEIPDPSFLTSASYVLRSAFSHLRFSDSWKLISRIRYVQQSLARSSRQEHLLRVLRDQPVCPDDAWGRVIASFKQWRGWDLAHLEQNKLLLNIYGPRPAPKGGPRNSSTEFIKAMIKTSELRLVIDPGPGQNELAILNLVAGFGSDRTEFPNSGANGHPTKPALRKTNVEVFCVQFTTHLNWDVCQLAEDIVQHFQSTSIAQCDTVPPLDLQRDIHSIHTVVVVGTGSFRFNCINLQLASLGRNLKASMLMSSGTFQETLINGLISAEVITSDISSQSRLLILSELLSPTILASLTRAPTRPSGWKLAASCSHCFLDVREDPLGLLGIADLVVGDEIEYISRMARSLKKGNDGFQPVSVAHEDGLSDIKIVLSLAIYNISITLLPSLKYVIKGQAAKSSLRQDATQTQRLILDFDIKEHTQGFVNQIQEINHNICILPLPPINGQLIFKDVKTRKSIVLYVAMESTVLHASSLQGLISTSMQSELSNLQKSIVRDAKIVSMHYKNVFGASDTADVPSEFPSDSTVLYTAYIAAAGLTVEATANESVDRSARMRLELGLMSTTISNHHSQDREVLKFAEGSFRLREVKLLLDRSTASADYPCGNIVFAISFRGTSRFNDTGKLVRSYELYSSDLEINLYTETASMVVGLLGQLQKKLKTLDLTEEIKNLRARRRLRVRPAVNSHWDLADDAEDDVLSSDLFTSMYSLEMNDIQVSWNIGDSLPISPGHESEDLVLSISKVDLATKKNNAARLMIQDFQIQMVPNSKPKRIRSFNSALLPEVVFNVAYLSTKKDRRLAFQAVGKSLDLRLTSEFILPASDLQRSIGIASQELRKVVANWNATLPEGDEQDARSILGSKKLSSMLVDAEFGGAVVYIQGKRVSDPELMALNALHGGRLPQHGRYGQFTHHDASSSTTLRAPGIAWKIEYKDLGVEEPSLDAEIRVNASTNTLYPTVVPLILEISSSVKEVVGEPQQTRHTAGPRSSPPKFLDDEKLKADPTAILGRCKLNLGLRICRQEFSLSCQPIARVAATAKLEDIYITVNTVQAADQTRFFAVFASFAQLQASVQHVYSRESTGSFEVESIVMSLMNSKHVSNAKGLSAILKISPMKVQINAKQLQDFLLFREIWVPPEMRHSPAAPASTPPAEAQTFVVQRYQQVAAAGAFPWNATVSITELDVHLDLGQSLGKSRFSITNFWVSSKKSSDWEQNLCLGFDKVGVDSTGRMSGFVELQSFRVRTSIRWPEREEAHNQTPLVQASLGFDALRVKAAFDYQAFLVADLSSLEFLMYNVRETRHASGDRLVCIVDGDKAQVFCTTTSAAQGLALYQAVQRLIQEKQTAYENSLKDIEKYLRRSSTVNPLEMHAAAKQTAKPEEGTAKAPIQLHTSVVVTFQAINVGAFPSMFFDNQIFKLEALNTSARFTVALEQGKVHSGLGLTIGQLRIALSGVTKPNVPKTLGEISVDEVVKSATSSRGGTILKVPKVVATMQTWQTPESSRIDFIFKSAFEGKVEVGWNYSRISFIRGMWSNHSRSLAQRLGKPLPQSALQITGGPQPDDGRGPRRPSEGEEEKITAVVHVPQSKYHYVALEPPIIETPQLRDMGEATPPLEWIGLHRERLPNVTHQIVIVSLLEVAKEVEDAYSRILGSS
ncbi:MAG: hypothetical protein Q9187_000307 [Circinaria calcarea]